MLNEQRILEVSVKFKGALFFMRQCRDAYSQYPAFHAILDLVDKCAYPGGRTEEQKVKKLRANCYAIMAISDIFSRGIPIFSLIDELCEPLVDEVLTDEQDEAEAMYGNSQEKGQRHYDASKYCERCHCVEGTNTDCPECRDIKLLTQIQDLLQTLREMVDDVEVPYEEDDRLLDEASNFIDLAKDRLLQILENNVNHD